MTDIQRLLHELTLRNGVARAGELAGISWRALAEAVRSGVVVRPARGRYALADVDPHLCAAHRLTGVRSHLSAALAHGWAVAHRPSRPQVIVPRGRNVCRREQDAVDVRWREMSPEAIKREITDPLDTVLDCARTLPFGEGLAVADSALRSGLVGAEEFRRAADRLKGAGAVLARRVAAAADGRSANPFESMLRAVCLHVRGLDVTPQVVVAHSPTVRVDLADIGLGLVIEADSFEWHGQLPALIADAKRYNRLAVAGWMVLRFTYAEVVGAPEAVASILTEAAARRRRRSPRPVRRARTANPHSCLSP